MKRYLLSMLIFACLPALFAQNHSLLSAGPMLGHVDIVEAKIWLQTREAASVAIRYWSGDDAAKAQTTPALKTRPEDYFTAIVVVTDLLENTLYSYQVLINDQPVSLAYPTTFKTQKFWQWRTDPPPLRIAFGSCLYVNDAYFDRPGRPYGSAPDIFKQIMAVKPDAMFWLGDNLYLRETDFFSPTRLAYRYRHDRMLPDLQPLLAAFPHYATWDDHDYGPNDSNRSYALKHVTLDLFTKYWANPCWGMPDTPGVFGWVNIGDLDFFLTDNRYYRAPKHLMNEKRPYLGPGQFQWLKDCLLTSKAPFKFIVSGSQVLNTYNPFEAMPHHPEEFQELMAFIKLHNIPGVIFLSGDRHHAELFKQEREGTYPLYEFTSSSLSAGLAKIAKEEVGMPIRVEGTLVEDKNNFGILEVNGPQEDRILTMKTIDIDGQQRWSVTIAAKDLK